MNKRIVCIVLYCLFFVTGLVLVLCSESIADRQTRVFSADNPYVSSVNIDELNRKMIRIIVAGGVIALTAGNGIVLTVYKKDEGKS